MATVRIATRGIESLRCIATLRFSILSVKANEMFSRIFIARCVALLGWYGFGVVAIAQETVLDTVTVNAPASENEASLGNGEIDRRRLRERQSGSLGETLAQEPGIAASGFAAGASRPIVRGLAGAHVGVTVNGADTADVSTLSPDHRSAVDTTFAKRIDILRGPAALRLQGGASGAVLDVQDTRIPDQLIKGNAGEFDAHGGTGNRETSANLKLDHGGGRVGLTLFSTNQSAGDYAIPGLANTNDSTSARERLPNSYNHNHSFGAGATWFGDDATHGASVSHMESHYGLPGDDASIRMRQTRVDARGDASMGAAEVSYRYSHTDYTHSEIEPDGATAARFDQTGDALSLESNYQGSTGDVRSMGLALGTQRFDATGEINFATDRYSQAVYGIGHQQWGNANAGGFVNRVDWGGRIEQQRFRPDASTGAAHRSFQPLSVSLAGVLPVGGQAAVFSTLTRSERAPELEALYANWAHPASSTYEFGDASLRTENSIDLDVGMRYRRERWSGSLAYFHKRFSRYTLGSYRDSNGDGFPDRRDANGNSDPTGEFVDLFYTQQAARFSGWEATLGWNMQGAGFNARATFDQVRARLTDGTPLPRITPQRLGLQVGWREQIELGWQLQLQALHTAAPDHLAPLETATPGWTRYDLGIAYVRRVNGAPWTFYLDGRNVTNQSIRFHTDYLKDRVPQPGRIWLAGIRGTF